MRKLRERVHRFVYAHCQFVCCVGAIVFLCVIADAGEIMRGRLSLSDAH